jgi:2-polyprenyl-3-methyl-5-hydroxy-6-metoxy-1,4-benzoquinol methylase
MEKQSTNDAKAGSAVYNRIVLSIYDLYVLGFASRFIWKCPKKYFIDLYNKHVSNNHLDVGVGSGFFLDKCVFPTSSPRIGLMDMNINCLQYTEKRLKRYKTEKYHTNILEPINTNIKLFDSIGLCGVLHCLPGNMETKGVVFDNLKKLLNPGGTLFGCTILYQDVQSGRIAKKLTEVYNKKKILTNLEDRLDVLAKKLKSTFSESSVEIKGCFAVFSAKK